MSYTHISLDAAIKKLPMLSSAVCFRKYPFSISASGANQKSYLLSSISRSIPLLFTTCTFILGGNNDEHGMTRPEIDAAAFTLLPTGGQVACLLRRAVLLQSGPLLKSPPLADKLRRQIIGAFANLELMEARAFDPERSLKDAESRI